MKSTPIPIVAILSLFLATSCGKKSNSHVQACRIISATDQGPVSNMTFNFTYDSYGRVSTEQVNSGNSSYSEAFTYAGNTVIVVSSYPTYIGKDSITLNNDGLLVSDYYSDNVGDTASTIYTYAGTEAQTSIYAELHHKSDTTTYAWTNGDLTESITNGYHRTYSYNTKPSEAGDYWQYIQLIDYYGVPFVRTAHEAVTHQVGTENELFSYTYDSTGKIAVITFNVNSSLETVTYQYMCN